MRSFKCICDGTEEFGVYDRMSVLDYNGNNIQVDSCMVNEIEFLLERGVNTVASCCGHKKTHGFIGVEGSTSIMKMKDLGYETDDSFKQTTYELGCFISKTI